MIKRRDLLSVAAYGVALVALLSLCFWLTSLDFGDFRPENPTVTYVLWALSTCVVLGAITLGFLLFRNLVKLHFEYRKRKLGSRIKIMLVAGVLGLGVTPIGLHVIYSITFLNRNLDKWFSHPTVEVMESAGRFMDQANAELLDALRATAERLASSPDAGSSLQAGSVSPALRALWQEGSGTYLALAQARGGSAPIELAKEGNPPSRILQPALGASDPSGYAAVSGEWLVASAPVREAGRQLGTLVVGRKISAEILAEQAFMQAQVDEWKELEAARPVMWRTHVYILALITIFMLFLAVWLAIFAAKQITRPIEALVTATGKLAGGQLDYRVDTPTTDELASLVESFNAMGQALEAKTGQLERSNREVEDRRRFIDAILESITPGVISVGENGEILKYNESARSFATNDSLDSLQSVSELLDGADQAAFQHMFSSARRTGISSREFEIERSGRSIHLGVTVSSLDSGDIHHGFVVVLEDNTELMRAQRSEAWQEVARRLAHEIKNPLTPVALAAGRIDRLIDRFANARDSSERVEIEGRLRSSVRVIEREAQSLKTLIDSFSELARFPTIRPEERDLNVVVRDAVRVFEGRLPDISLSVEEDAAVVLAIIDPEPMKRVIVNLIDNAAEVLRDSWVKEIVVSTRVRTDADTVELTVADSGPGISPEHKEKLFLPYFSTKSRGGGLGLPIVRNIIQDHGGTIRVEDNAPQGTRFIIEMPAARREAPELQEATA